MGVTSRGGHDVRRRRSADPPRVTSQRFHLALDVVVKDDQLRGQVCDGAGSPKPFSGWLGLIAALDALLDTAGATDDEPCT